MKRKIKAGDEVVVIAGNARGERAKVMQVMPTAGRVLLEGINKRKHYEKKTQETPEGSITEREAPIHISNVTLAATCDGKRTNKEANK